MKKTLILMLCAVFCLSFTSCTKVNIPSGADGTTYFIYGEENITSEINADDTELIAKIFNGKTLYSDNPSCGFSKDVSVTMGSKTFCFACDNCKIVYVQEEDKYFSLSEEENETLKQILASYGMYFPCV